MGICFLLNAVSLSDEVFLELTIESESSSLTDCDHLGLTNTSLVVEYRITSSTSVGGWIRIANFSRVQLHDSAADGFQIRVLQLEHGGGFCNCWKVNNIDIDCGNGMIVPNITMCSEQGLLTASGTFCFGYASRARGMITEVYCSVSNYSEPCPGDSDTLLPSGGPAFPSHCETSDFRM